MLILCFKVLTASRYSRSSCYHVFLCLFCCTYKLITPLCIPVSVITNSMLLDCHILQRAGGFVGIGNQSQSHHQMQTQTRCLHFSQVLASKSLPLLLLIPPANYCTPHKVTHQVFEYFFNLISPHSFVLPFPDSDSTGEGGRNLKYLQILRGPLDWTIVFMLTRT